jgi:hypothetical protein
VGTGSAATPLRSPIPRRFDSFGLRAIRNTVGRLKKYTTNRSRAVQNPRVRANPRTEPTDTTYSTAAPIAVTMSAATIVRHDRLNAGCTAVRKVFPLRTSSFSRS